jgi:hypothetical protein
MKNERNSFSLNICLTNKNNGGGEGGVKKIERGVNK